MCIGKHKKEGGLSSKAKDKADTSPFCNTSTSPFVAKIAATSLVKHINGCHCSLFLYSLRGTSLGQHVAPGLRALRIDNIVVSKRSRTSSASEPSGDDMTKKGRISAKHPANREAHRGNTREQTGGTRGTRQPNRGAYGEHAGCAQGASRGCTRGEQGMHRGTLMGNTWAKQRVYKRHSRHTRGIGSMQGHTGGPIRRTKGTSRGHMGGYTRAIGDIGP